MSFLLKTSTRAIRTSALRTSAPRSLAAFSTSPLHQKSAVDSTKDAAKTVDRKIADAAVKGIDKGAELAEKAKSAFNSDSAEVKGKAEELKGQAKGKAEELKGTAKGKAEEVKGKM